MSYLLAKELAIQWLIGSFTASSKASQIANGVKPRIGAQGRVLTLFTHRLAGWRLCLPGHVSVAGSLVKQSIGNPLPALHGLVLTGGASTRMGEDKALLDAGGQPQLQATLRLLRKHARPCFVSLRAGQATEPLRAGLRQIIDCLEGVGPAAGLLAAHAAHPQAAWLVLACDLPLLNDAALEALIRARDGRHAAIGYRSGHDDLPEPLCMLWEPHALECLAQQVRAGRNGLREALRQLDTLLLPAPPDGALDNANTPQERERLLRRMRPDAGKE